MKQKLIIVGARALGRNVCNYARDAGFDVVGFLDDKADALDGFVGYPPVLGTVEAWRVSLDDRFVCAIGDSKARAMYTLLIEKRGGVFVSVIHPMAYIGPNVKIGDGCIVCPFAVVDCDLAMGRHVIANVHALVSHDCVIDDFVTLSPGVHLGGRTEIRREAFLGIGVSTIPGVKIGEGSIVAASACVTKDVSDRVLVAGVPAEIKKCLAS